MNRSENQSLSAQNTQDSTTSVLQIAPHNYSVNGNLINIENLLAKKEVIRKSVAKGSTDAELEFFLNICVERQLSPFSGKIHFMKIGDKVSVITGIDGFRSLAARTGKYKGQTPILYSDEEGNWSELWMKKTPPFACKVGVINSNFENPVYYIALWSENSKRGGQWDKMPSHMLAVRAQCHALRMAFPDELGGIYGEEEMYQEKNDAKQKEDIIDVPPQKTKYITGQPRIFITEKIRVITEEIDDISEEERKKIQIAMFIKCSDSLMTNPLLKAEELPYGFILEQVQSSLIEKAA